MGTIVVKAMKASDTSDYELDGTTSRQRVYRFYLEDQGPPVSQHGPFTEKVPLTNFDPYEITRRIDLLKQHLRDLPK